LVGAIITVSAKLWPPARENVEGAAGDQHESDENCQRHSLVIIAMLAVAQPAGSTVTQGDAR
jgi:hypothetical protein